MTEYVYQSFLCKYVLAKMLQLYYTKYPSITMHARTTALDDYSYHTLVRIVAEVDRSTLKFVS